MKSLKKIVSVVLAVSMIIALSSVAFAAEIDWTNEIEFSTIVTPATVAPGEDVTIAFYVKDKTYDDAVILTDGGTFGIKFAVDAEKFTYKSATVGQELTKTFGTEVRDGVTYYTNILECAATKTIATDSAVFTYVFTVNESVANGTYDFVTATYDPYVGDGAGNEADSYTTNFAKVTVAAAGGEGGGSGSTVTATAGETVNNITAYTIANDAEIDGTAKKVITKTFDTIEINDATRVYVTINGEDRVFGSDLVSATSGLTVGKLTFGIIVDKNVDLTTVTDFRFE